MHLAPRDDYAGGQIVAPVPRSEIAGTAARVGFFLEHPLRALRFLTASKAELGRIHGALHVGELASLARGIVGVFPPQEHVYICIGRSPFAVGAVLEKLAPGHVFTLPFSYTYHYGWRDQLLAKVIPGHPNAQDVPPFMTQSPRMRAHTTRLLERFLPSPAVLNGRRLVLIDYSEGRTLEAVYADLAQYFADKGQKVGVDVAAFTSVYGHCLDSNLRYTTAKVANFRIGSKLRDLLDAQTLKPFAPFGRYVAGRDGTPNPAQPQPNTGYAIFSKALDDAIDACPGALDVRPSRPDIVQERGEAARRARVEQWVTFSRSAAKQWEEAPSRYAETSHGIREAVAS